MERSGSRSHTRYHWNKERNHKDCIENTQVQPRGFTDIVDDGGDAFGVVVHPRPGLRQTVPLARDLRDGCDLLSLCQGDVEVPRDPEVSQVVAQALFEIAVFVPGNRSSCAVRPWLSTSPTHFGMTYCFFCSGVHDSKSSSSIEDVLHQWSMDAPKKDEDRWWQPIRRPSIHVNKKIMICHFPSEPIMSSKSSNLSCEGDERGLFGTRDGMFLIYLTFFPSVPMVKGLLCHRLWQMERESLRPFFSVSSVRFRCFKRRDWNKDRETLLPLSRGPRRKKNGKIASNGGWLFFCRYP